MTADTAADLEPDRQEMAFAESLRRRLTVPVGRRIDVLLAGLLAAAAFLVHDVRYVLTAPLWNDETWVAISTKLSLGDLLRVTASSPPGWTLLLRLVPFGYPEGVRIVPMLFAALTVVAAFVYARSLPWRSVLAGRTAATLAGVAALLVPSVLERNDLKQYTADAFFTLVTLWFVSRLESHWSRRRLIQLAACIAIAFIFSATALFVGAACFTGVILTAITRRRWRQARDALVVGALCGGLLISFYVAVYRPGLPPGLNLYWARDYVPLSNGWAGVGRLFLRRRTVLLPRSAWAPHRSPTTGQSGVRQCCR